MLRNIRTAWFLWKLVRRLGIDDASVAGASLTVKQEGGAFLAERTRICTANGEAPPDPYQACEVVVWANVGQPSKVHRGWDLAQALRGALR